VVRKSAETGSELAASAAPTREVLGPILAESAGNIQLPNKISAESQREFCGTNTPYPYGRIAPQSLARGSLAPAPRPSRQGRRSSPGVSPRPGNSPRPSALPCRCPDKPTSGGRRVGCALICRSDVACVDLVDASELTEGRDHLLDRVIAVRFGDNLEMARGLLLPRAIAFAGG
jgi:hypothetical protein